MSAANPYAQPLPGLRLNWRGSDADVYRKFVDACNAMTDGGRLPEGWDDIGDGGSNDIAQGDGGTTV